MNTIAFASIIGSGVLISAISGPTAMSYPPQYHFKLAFRAPTALRGMIPTEDGLWEVPYIAKDLMEPPVFDLNETYVFAAEHTPRGSFISAIAKAGTDLADEIERSASGAIGWAQGCPFKVERPYEPLPATVSMTLRGDDSCPAVPEGKNWRDNPDGNGELILTLKNTGDASVTVPVYGETAADSILVGVGEEIHTMAGQSAQLAEPTVLKPNEALVIRFNMFTIEQDSENWPRGGYRLPIRAVLGGQTARVDFYYKTDHHEPIKNEVRSKLGL